MSLNPIYIIPDCPKSDIPKLQNEFEGYCLLLEQGKSVANATRFYQLYNTILDKRQEFAGVCSSCLKRMMGEFYNWRNAQPKIEEVLLPPNEVPEAKIVKSKRKKV